MADPHQEFINRHFNQGPHRPTLRGEGGASPGGDGPRYDGPPDPKPREYWSEKDEALAQMDTTKAGKARWETYRKQRWPDNPLPGDSSPLPPRKKTK